MKRRIPLFLAAALLPLAGCVKNPEPGSVPPKDYPVGTMKVEAAIQSPLDISWSSPDSIMLRSDAVQWGSSYDVVKKTAGASSFAGSFRYVPEKRIYGFSAQDGFWFGTEPDCFCSGIPTLQPASGSPARSCFPLYGAATVGDGTQETLNLEMEPFAAFAKISLAPGQDVRKIKVIGTSLAAKIILSTGRQWGSFGSEPGKGFLYLSEKKDTVEFTGDGSEMSGEIVLAAAPDSYEGVEAADFINSSDSLHFLFYDNAEAVAKKDFKISTPMRRNTLTELGTVDDLAFFSAKAFTVTAGALKGSWKAGDEIAVCDGENVVKIKLAASDISGNVASLKDLSGLSRVSHRFWFVYPASVAGQTADKFLDGDNVRLYNSGAAGSDVWSVAAVDNTFGTVPVTMNDAGALVKISTSNPAVSTIRLNPERRDSLLSNPAVNPATGEVVSSSGMPVTQLDLSVKDGETVVCVEPSVWENGYVLRCYDSSGAYLGFYDGFSSIDVARGQTFTVPGFDAGFHPKKTDLPDFVDLGLPANILFATSSLGASSPTESGDFYAWGEILPKSYYYLYDADNNQNYRFGKAASKLNKYTLTDGLTVLDEFDDAVTMNYGPGYRMPTKEELALIPANCLLVAVNGKTVKYQGSSVAGILIYKSKGDTYRNFIDAQEDCTVTGKKSGLTYSLATDPHIFLPAAGSINKDAASGLNTKGYYLSSTFSGTDIGKVVTFTITVSTSSYNAGYLSTRYFGSKIRAVKVAQ